MTENAAPPPSRFRQSRRREIALAAQRVLERDGVAQLTARRVAAEAGLSLGHITYNFDGMDDVLSEAYRLISAQLRAASDRSLEAVADDPRTRLEAFLRAGFAPEFLEFRHLRVRIDLWSAARTSERLARTERALYDHYRATLETLLLPLAGGDAAKTAAVPALLDTLMATLDGLWLDWLRRRDDEAVANGLRMCMTLVGQFLPG